MDFAVCGGSLFSLVRYFFYPSLSPSLCLSLFIYSEKKNAQAMPATRLCLIASDTTKWLEVRDNSFSFVFFFFTLISLHTLTHLYSFSPLKSASFSSSMNYIASANKDRTLRVWDISILRTSQDRGNWPAQIDCARLLGHKDKLSEVFFFSCVVAAFRLTNLFE